MIRSLFRNGWNVHSLLKWKFCWDTSSTIRRVLLPFWLPVSPITERVHVFRSFTPVHRGFRYETWFSVVWCWTSSLDRSTTHTFISRWPCVGTDRLRYNRYRLKCYVNVLTLQWWSRTFQILEMLNPQMSFFKGWAWYLIMSYHGETSVCMYNTWVWRFPVPLHSWCIHFSIFLLPSYNDTERTCVTTTYSHPSSLSTLQIPRDLYFDHIKGVVTFVLVGFISDLYPSI